MLGHLDSTRRKRVDRGDWPRYVRPAVQFSLGEEVARQVISYMMIRSSKKLADGTTDAMYELLPGSITSHSTLHGYVRRAIVGQTPQLSHIFRTLLFSAKTLTCTAKYQRLVQLCLARGTSGLKPDLSGIYKSTNHICQTQHRVVLYSLLRRKALRKVIKSSFSNRSKVCECPEAESAEKACSKFRTSYVHVLAFYSHISSP